MVSSSMKRGSRDKVAKKTTYNGRGGKRKVTDMNRPEYNHSGSKTARDEET